MESGFGGCVGEAEEERVAEEEGFLPFLFLFPFFNGERERVKEGFVCY